MDREINDSTDGQNGYAEKCSLRVHYVFITCTCLISMVNFKIADSWHCCCVDQAPKSNRVQM